MESLTSFSSIDLLSFSYYCPVLLATVFDVITSNIDEVLSINPSANAFVWLEFNNAWLDLTWLMHDFNIHHKDCLT